MESGDSIELNAQVPNVDPNPRGTERAELSTSTLVMLFASLWTGGLFVALDETMIATIATPIVTSFNSFSCFSWLTMGYVLGSSISQAYSSYLTNLYGRRDGLMLCFGVFAVGTLVCGLAPKIGVVLIGRILQGVGGGSICSMTSFVETDLLPMRKRALVEGLNNIAYGVVLALGGIYGAGVQSTIGWRWAFLIQVPILVIDAVFVYILVGHAEKRRRVRLEYQEADLFGMVSLFFSMILLQGGLNIGSTTMKWTRVSVLVPLCLAGVFFCSFIWWEWCRADDPVIPLRALKIRTVACVQISAFFGTGAFVCCMFYVPLYLEFQGLSTMETGLRLVPLAITFASGSVLTGYLVQFLYRYYAVNIVLQCIPVISYSLLCQLNFKTPSWQVFFALGILGFGVGGSYVTNLLGILTSVSERDVAPVQAASWSVRAFGIAVSLTFASVIFQMISQHQLSASLHDPKLVAEFLDTIATKSGSFEDLDPSTKEAVLNAYVKALQGVFWFLLAEGITSVAASLFSGNNEIRAEDAGV